MSAGFCTDRLKIQKHIERHIHPGTVQIAKPLRNISHHGQHLQQIPVIYHRAPQIVPGIDRFLQILRSGPQISDRTAHFIAGGTAHGKLEMDIGTQQRGLIVHGGGWQGLQCSDTFPQSPGGIITPQCADHGHFPIFAFFLAVFREKVAHRYSELSGNIPYVRDRR